MPNSHTANLCGVAAIAIWSFTPVMLALTGNAPPFLVGAFSFLFAFGMTCAWWIYRGENILQKFVMPWSSYALGIYGMCLYNIVFIYVFKAGPVLEVNLLNYVWPAFLIIVSCLMQKKAPDLYALVGIAFCFTGSLFIFESRGPLSFSGSHLMLALAVVCGFMWGSYSALSKYVSTNVDQLAVFFLIAGLVMLALHLAYEPTVWPETLLGCFMLLAYALGRVAFFLWDYAMKHGQTRYVATLSYFLPLLATLVLAAAGFATYNIHLLTGAALIIGGSLIINLKALLRAITAKGVPA